jgi:hypothetical protein
MGGGDRAGWGEDWVREDPLYFLSSSASSFSDILACSDLLYIIQSITCGGTTFPHEAVFCSRQCEFEYEKEYCRNNQ